MYEIQQQQKRMRRRRQQVSTSFFLNAVLQFAACSFSIGVTTTSFRTHQAVNAYVPNHPIHPLHPILTSSSPAAVTADISSLSSKQSIKTKDRNNDPNLVVSRKIAAAASAAAVSASQSHTFVTTTLATPSMDQLELQQLLQRRNNNTTTAVEISAVSKTKKRKTSIPSRRSKNGMSSSSTSTLKDTKVRAGSSSSNNKNYVPLLTAGQEMEYAYQIRTLRAALRIREQLVSYQNGIFIHPTEEQWCAACGCTSKKQLRRIIHEGQDAKTQLISANTGLVMQYAKKQYSNLKYAMEAGGGVGTILTVSDMIQEGHFGLIEAAERFQPEKGFRFSTYATYWVKQRILRCISDTSRTIRLPVHVHEMLYKIKKAKRTIFSQTGQEPTISELAQHLEISEDRIRSYTASSRNVVSLERPLSGTNNNGGVTKSTTSARSSGAGSSTSRPGTSGSSKSTSSSDDTRTLLDSIASDGPTPEEDAVLDSMRRDIRAVLDTELGGLEQQVVRYRFGLLYDDDGDYEAVRKQVNSNGEAYSVKETSQLLKISMDKVRLLEARALNKLRHPMRNYKLKDYVQGIASNGGGSSFGRRRRSTSGNDYPTNSPITESTAVSSTPVQQWMSFQSFDDITNHVDHGNNIDLSGTSSSTTKSRLEETFANSPSNMDASNRRSLSSSADRLWFF